MWVCARENVYIVCVCVCERGVSGEWGGIGEGSGLSQWWRWWGWEEGAERRRRKSVANLGGWLAKNQPKCSILFIWWEREWMGWEVLYEFRGGGGGFKVCVCVK